MRTREEIQTEIDNSRDEQCLYVIIELLLDIRDQNEKLIDLAEVI